VKLIFNLQHGISAISDWINSLVDQCCEIFSSSVLAENANGLASVRWVDANADGYISSADPVYNQLRVWQDANGNGIVDDGEAKSLSNMGISTLHYGRDSYGHAVDRQTRALGSASV